MEFLFFGLILLAIPFVLPILAWLSARSARQHFQVLQGQLETLVRVVESQEKEIDGLRASVARLAGAPPAAPSPVGTPTPAPAADRAARHRSTRCCSVNGCRPVTSGASAARRASGSANCRSAVFSGGRSTAACAPARRRRQLRPRRELHRPLPRTRRARRHRGHPRQQSLRRRHARSTGKVLSG